MIEILKHAVGICGDHWHPNALTLLAGSPMVLAAVTYIKCKCGGMFNHKKSCKHE